jgi:ABC-type dipeptide/oligopeptide/nickel transport system permease subunit
MTPHLLPQLLTGFVLSFPHAILHEASLTFLGFGLSPEQPAIGVILSESMKYLAMGKWWLALFPGVLLAAVVLLFHLAGEMAGRLMDPRFVHR